MVEEAQLTALLHVATVLTVLSLAFLGLDSAHIDQPNFAHGMSEAKPKAKAVLLRLGLSASDPVKIWGAGWWFRLQTTFLAAVICVIADDELDLGKALYCAHVCHRQRHIPLWDYFKGSAHLRNVWFLALFSVMVLALSAGAIIWKQPWLDPSADAFDGFSHGWLVKLLFVFEVLGLIWLTVTGGVMRALNKERLENKCERLGKLISQHFDDAKERERQKFRRNRDLLKGLVAHYNSVAERARRQAAHVQQRLDQMGDGGEG